MTDIYDELSIIKEKSKFWNVAQCVCQDQRILAAATLSVHLRGKREKVRKRGRLAMLLTASMPSL